MITQEILQIPYIEYDENDDIDRVLADKPMNKIDVSSWGNTSQQVSAGFKIAHNNKAIILQYNIVENELLARFNNHLEPVYKDSCVEMFLTFEGDNNYYNFEFNNFGTCLAAYGPNRHGRPRLPLNAINKIKTSSAIKRINDEGFNWQLFLYLPIEVFVHHSFKSLAGIKAKANFYKCGDELKQPHYLSWKRIGTPKPDFHQPAYFGEVYFQ